MSICWLWRWSLLHPCCCWNLQGLEVCFILLGKYYWDCVALHVVFFYLMRPFGKRRISNLFVLFALSVGGANLTFYYQVELAARLYCPQKVRNSYPEFQSVIQVFVCMVVCLSLFILKTTGNHLKHQIIAIIINNYYKQPLCMNKGWSRVATYVGHFNLYAEAIYINNVTLRLVAQYDLKLL